MGSWETQEKSDGLYVGTKQGHDRDTGKDVVEFIVDEKAGDHQHLGIDAETGDTVFHNLNIRHDR